MNTKNILTEAYKAVKDQSGIDMCQPNQYFRGLTSNDTFNLYTEAMSDGLTPTQKDTFKKLCETTRRGVLENSMFQLNPYDVMVVPILRKFIPKDISSELVTTTPIDKPVVFLPFVHAYFQTSGGSGYDYEFPDVDNDVSKGEGTGYATDASATSGQTDILTAMGYTTSEAHLDRDFRIVKCEDSTGNTTNVDIRPDGSGEFSSSVTVAGVSSFVSGQVDYENGTLTWCCPVGDITKVYYEVHISLEENSANPKMRWTVEDIRLAVEGDAITAEWSTEMQQDVKALYDLDLQAEFVNIMSDQIALSIGEDIVDELIAAVDDNGLTNHTDTFSKTVPATFSWGKKEWYSNIIPPISHLSAAIENSVHMGKGNVIAANAQDAAIFESINSFSYNGASDEGGDVGYRTGEINGGSWKVVTSSIVPQGTMVIVYRSSDRSRAVYQYAPYIPVMIEPYPLGNKRSMTVKSRYAKRLIRAGGISKLTIS